MNDYIQDLSNSFSMSLPEEYSWSLANVLGLFYEPETYFCSLAGPQGILQNSDNYLRMWQFQGCQVELYEKKEIFPKFLVE